MPINIGSLNKSLYVIIDTGSFVLWIPEIGLYDSQK